MSRLAKLLLLAPLGVAAAIGEGYGAFVYLGYGDGPFVSLTGLAFTVGAAVADVFLVALIVFKLDELHAGISANPHSRIGQTLRKDTGHPPPPEARAAWDGQWEDPNQAAGKMGRDR